MKNDHDIYDYLIADAVAKQFRELFPWVFREGKKYWYNLKYSYKINNIEQFSFVGQVGLAKQHTVLEERTLKKLTDPLHKVKAVKHLLKNGDLNIDSYEYLGRFRRIKTLTPNTK